jgi:hypothetical protein
MPSPFPAGTCRAPVPIPRVPLLPSKSAASLEAGRSARYGLAIAALGCRLEGYSSVSTTTGGR